MKDIRDMTLEEIIAEIRSYEFQRYRGYAFVSYSHRDREQVYPLVLSWLRAGCNIYIDLDFERHGSDSHWADLMLSTLSSRLCRLGICFKSAHYRYSYASLLELLTMRGETVTSRHGGKRLPVDSIALEAIPDDDEVPAEVQELYASAFQALSDRTGEQFLGQNAKEADLLRDGLEFWIGGEKAKALLGPSVTAEKMMGYIQDAYQAGFQDFFPQIAYLVKNWFVSQDLNGNDYTLQSSMSIRLARFDEARVERVREAVFTPRRTEAPPPPPPTPSGEETDFTVMISEEELLEGEEEEESYISPVDLLTQRIIAASSLDLADCLAGGGEDSGLPCTHWLTRHNTDEEIPMPGKRFALGRSKVCDYSIPGNKAIGRIHAIFLMKDEDCVVIDQHSRNGTYLNGDILEPEQTYSLQDGDSIRISQEVFIYHQ